MSFLSLLNIFLTELKVFINVVYKRRLGRDITLTINILPEIFITNINKRYCICDALRDLVSVTISHLYGRSNACECLLTLFLPSCCFYPFALVSMAFGWVYQMSNVWMPFKRVTTSNLMTFEWCFLILI